MNKKVYFYIIGLLILVAILFLVFTQVSKNQESKGNLGIYDAVDNSVNDFLSQRSSENQTQNIYDAVDASVEQFLNK